MKEEQEIIRKCGKGNPFIVPEGYFEDFARNIMTQLPTENYTAEDDAAPVVTMWQRVKPLLYMAAMFIGMIMCVRVVLGDHMTNNTINSDNLAALEFSWADFEQMSDEELASMVEYTMMDNYSLYQYLSEIE
ncbi:MAG: hypothetical protein IKY31_06665 [Bacteroidaceae bacterium]|nr:hypothetical protein [Bacteroidaceae bacterium]